MAEKKLSKYEIECITDAIADIQILGSKEALTKLVWLIKINEIDKWADKYALLVTELKKMNKDIN